MSIGMKAPSEAAELTGDRDMQWTSYRHQGIKSALLLYLRKPAGASLLMARENGVMGSDRCHCGSTLA